MKLSEGLKYSKGANFCSLISGQTRPEWNGRPVLFPTRAHGSCPSVSVRVPAPLQIFLWKNLIPRSFRSCCHPASLHAVIWQELACNLQEVEVLFVLKLPNSSLQGKQKAALLPPCRCAFCCELPPTLPNESCNVCRNANTFALLENVVLWKIFSCRRRFRMPPVKSSCYILLQAVLVVFPPLTFLNLGGFIFPGKNFGLSLAGLVKEEITKWERCCLTLWCRYKYSARAKQWGLSLSTAKQE